MPRRLQAAVSKTHLDETKEQVERLKECFALLGVPSQGQAVQGHGGAARRRRRGHRAKARSRNPTAADLALIAAAQKVEHYEISGYGRRARWPGRSALPAVAELLSRVLGEEEIADNLLTQIARELMSASRTGISKDDELTDGDTGSRKTPVTGASRGSAVTRSTTRKRNTT